MTSHKERKKVKTDQEVAEAVETEIDEKDKSIEECLTEENEAIIIENDELKKSNENILKEKDEVTETLQLHQAEFENFRKRTIKEKEDLRISAAGNLLTDLLPVLDNFERALLHGQDDPLYQGVKMVQKQMLDILVSSGLVIVGVEGEEFDPKVHDAIAREEKAGTESGIVIEVLQPGYMFHEKLLRPAMVKVSA